MRIPLRTTSDLAFLFIFSLLLTACPGGGGGSSSTPIASFELVDPSWARDNNYGSSIVILGNGNIVVTEPFDDLYATNSGAVHLYNPYTQTRLASFYGDNANDQLGSGGITALANNNFVIASPVDNAGGIVDAGTVMLVDGSTGTQIGITQMGDRVSDFLGSGGITALANNNFVIASLVDNVGSIANAGSVMLEIGRAACRDRGSVVVKISGVPLS